MGNYTSNDLTSLSSGRAYREKIGMYLSADRQEAINLGLRELIVNAQDEYEVYKPQGAKLVITLDTENRRITVEDNLRGIPVGVREDGINSLTAAFLIPHSGAKHSEGAYSSSIGINGQGNKIVCHTATELTVWVRRDENLYRQTFQSDDEGAKLIEFTTVGKQGKETGTIISYTPDPRVYGEIFIDLKSLRTMLQEMSLFTKGLHIELVVDQGEPEVFYSENGLVDGLCNPNALSKPFSYFYDNGECQVELALQWVTKSGDIKGYANGLYMPDGGAFITGFRTSLTRKFNDLAKVKLEGVKIRSLLDGYVSVKVKQGEFTNQQKTALANTEAREPASRAIAEALEKFYKEQSKDFAKVVDLLSKIDKADKAAERARASVLNAAKEINATQKKKVFASDKLKDSITLGENSSLILTEGNSAAGTMITARDADTYGVMALRGKIISALTNDMEKVLNNEEVRLIISALGLSLKSYREKDLRYGKIIIATDGDADGANISNLLITLFHVLFPEFLRQGRLYRMHAPLYRVTKGKQTQYCYSEEEKQSSTITGWERWKGLGSVNKAEAKEIFFSDEHRRLEQLVYDADAAQTIERLLGTDVEPRREFIFNEIDFEKYGEL